MHASAHDHRVSVCSQVDTSIRRSASTRHGGVANFRRSVGRHKQSSNRHSTDAHVIMHGDGHVCPPARDTFTQTHAAAHRPRGSRTGTCPPRRARSAAWRPPPVRARSSSCLRATAWREHPRHPSWPLPPHRARAEAVLRSVGVCVMARK